MKRLRKQSDGTYHLTDVQPHPAGLSTSGTLETTLVVLTQEDVDAIVADAKNPVADPQPAPTSDTSKAEGLSNQKAE